MRYMNRKSYKILTFAALYITISCISAYIVLSITINYLDIFSSILLSTVTFFFTIASLNIVISYKAIINESKSSIFKIHQQISFNCLIFILACFSLYMLYLGVKLQDGNGSPNPALLGYSGNMFAAVITLYGVYMSIDMIHKKNDNKPSPPNNAAGAENNNTPPEEHNS